MKSRYISKIYFLIILVTLFDFFPYFLPLFDLPLVARDINLENMENFGKSESNPKVSKFSNTIFIDSNWSAAKGAGICTGSGTYNQPYVIEDLIIDGRESRSCIHIEGSDYYFLIENCTLFNSRYGIYINYGNYARIYKNNCSLLNTGLYIIHSDSIIISDNIVSNSINGIHLESSDSSDISGNSVYTNALDGLYLSNSNGGYIQGNNASFNSNGISFYSCSNIDISGNYLENNSDYGMLLHFSDHNTISENIAKGNTRGIYITRSNSNSITSNIANKNNLAGIYCSFSTNVIKNNIAKYNFYGIHLYRCSFSTISGNTLTENEVCIKEEYCEGNKFSDNGSCTYGEIAFDLILSILSIIGGAAIILGALIINKRRLKRMKKR
jgi:parallel beta-helix repeat protein